MRHKVGLLLGL